MSGPRTCRANIVDAGFPNRTPLVLARERGLYAAMVTDLDGAADDGEPGITVDGEPGADNELPSVTIESLEKAFGSRNVSALHAATFIAGRCEPEKSADGAVLVEALQGVVDGLDAAHLGSRALPFVDAAMSLVLRGEHEDGTAALQAVSSSARGTMGDYLAAFYLAELGDPSGYPTLVKQLGASDSFTRLMAARHLASFLPYNGQVIDGEAVDVRARLVDRIDDEDELVAIQIPGLLAEADVEGLEALLGEIVSENPRPDVKQAAEHVLDHLQGRA